MKLPKIGDKIYIHSSFYISRGEDDVLGGLATINKVEVSKHLPIEHCNSVMIGVKEVSSTLYNYKSLLEEQEELKKQFGENSTRPDPDINTPWIQSGDIVNGEIYTGKDIW